MRRKTFDVLTASAGLLLAVVLLAAGGLLTWAHNFVDNQVHDQLVAQKIFFPKAGSESLNDPAVKPYLTQYAGQQVVTGQQAEAFANHYIAVHLKESGGGLTYAELSTKSRANRNDQKLAEQVQTSFRGETLRGLLLNAYAFWKMGQIAMYAAIASFIAAALMIALSALGFAHATRTAAEREVLPKFGAQPTPHGAV